MNEQIEQVTWDQYALMAQYYDQLYPATVPGDLPLYLELARRQAGPVLDLGCGTGRVTFGLAEAGYAVTALDNSPAMLSRFKVKLAAERAEVQQRISLVETSMVDFALEGRFSLVLAPFRAFMHLLTVADQQACLRSIHEHLAPGGLYVHNAFSPNLATFVDQQRIGKVWACDKEFTDPDRQWQIRRYRQLEYNLTRQILRVDWKFERYSRAGELESTVLETGYLRWQYRYEAEHLLHLCGFEIVAAYGGYDQRPLDDHAGELIFVCRRTSA